MRISSTCWLIGSTSSSTVMCRRWVPCCYFHLSSLHNQSCRSVWPAVGQAGGGEGVGSRHGCVVIESTHFPPPHHPWLLLFNTERLLILWWDNLRLSQKCQVEISFRKRHRLTGMCGWDMFWHFSCGCLRDKSSLHLGASIEASSIFIDTLLCFWWTSRWAIRSFLPFSQPRVVIPNNPLQSPEQ